MEESEGAMMTNFWVSMAYVAIVSAVALWFLATAARSERRL